MSVSSPDEHHHHRKKRVGKACDLCRIKKTKCDGKKPCLRCIADNKLCAFTEKKKPKEKAHPTGYIELLETRIDLLTRSLLKVVTMAEPHLPFLQQIVEKAKLEHEGMSPLGSDFLPLPEPAIPINEVVSFLISDMNLLADEPAQNMLRAEAAANMPEYGTLTRRSTSEHSPEESEFNEEYHGEITESQSLMSQNLQNLYNLQNLQIAQTSQSTRTARSLLDSASLFHNHGSPTHSRSSSIHLLHSTANDALSAASNTSLYHVKQDEKPFGGYLNSPPEIPHTDSALDTEPFSLRSNLLFLHNTASTSPLSISSLLIKLETQNPDHVRRLHSTQSYALIKRKNSGHVHKPVHSPQLFATHTVPGPGRSSYSNSQHQVKHHEPAGIRNANDYNGLDGTQNAFGYVDKNRFATTPTAPFDFENDLLYNEPPSKVIEDTPLFFDSELAMTNPFLGSLT